MPICELLNASSNAISSGVTSAESLSEQIYGFVSLEGPTVWTEVISFLKQLDFRKPSLRMDIIRRMVMQRNTVALTTCILPLPHGRKIASLFSQIEECHRRLQVIPKSRGYVFTGPSSSRDAFISLSDVQHMQ